LLQKQNNTKQTDPNKAAHSEQRRRGKQRYPKGDKSNKLAHTQKQTTQQTHNGQTYKQARQQTGEQTEAPPAPNEKQHNENDQRYAASKTETKQYKTKRVAHA
jgi:hypothetical protein